MVSIDQDWAKVLFALENRFLPEFQKEAESLKREFPHYKFGAVVNKLRGLSAPAYSLYLACGLPPDRIPDELILGIEVRLRDGKVEILYADITWGHPGGEAEASLYAKPQPWNDDVERNVAESLPKLFSAFRTGVKRGWPIRRHQQPK